MIDFYFVLTSNDCHLLALLLEMALWKSDVAGVTRDGQSHLLPLTRGAGGEDLFRFEGNHLRVRQAARLKGTLSAA